MAFSLQMEPGFSHRRWAGIRETKYARAKHIRGAKIHAHLQVSVNPLCSETLKYD